MRTSNPFLFLLLLLTFSACGQSKVSVKDIDAVAFQNKIQNAPGILLDVRTPQEIEKGFIGGAKFQDFLESDFQTQVLKLPKEQPIYVYCWKGGRSADAAEFLMKNGYTEVYNLDGGFDAWKKAQLPVSIP
jgi:rhodanese-related sulfurtransferase